MLEGVLLRQSLRALLRLNKVQQVCSPALPCLAALSLTRYFHLPPHARSLHSCLSLV